MKLLTKKVDLYQSNLLRKIFVIFMLLISAIFIISCGCPYSFTGAALPPHLKTIAIPYAEDLTGSGEPGLRDELTNGLVKKFIDDNSFTIADRTNSDAVIECSITGFSDAPAIITGGETVPSRRVTITVQAVYRDQIYKKVIFDKQFSNFGDYPSGSGFSDRSVAITSALEKIADDILLDTVSGW